MRAPLGLGESGDNFGYTVNYVYKSSLIMNMQNFELLNSMTLPCEGGERGVVIFGCRYAALWSNGVGCLWGAVNLYIKLAAEEPCGAPADNHAGRKYFEVLHHVRYLLINIKC